MLTNILSLEEKLPAPDTNFVSKNNVQYIFFSLPWHEKRNKYFAVHKDNKRNLLTKELRGLVLRNPLVLHFVAF